MDGTVTITLRLGDEAVVDTPTGEVTVKAVREGAGRMGVVIVADREFKIRRVPRERAPGSASPSE